MWKSFFNLFPGEMVTWLKLQRAAQVGHKEQTATKPGEKTSQAAERKRDETIGKKVRDLRESGTATLEGQSAMRATVLEGHSAMRVTML